MDLAVYYPPNLPFSSRGYIESVTAELKEMGHTIILFTGKELPPSADIYWQPSTGRNGPSEIFKKAEAPVVVTFHGAANLSLPLRICFKPGFKNQVYGLMSRINTFYSWRCRRPFWDAVITVSDFAKREAEDYLGIGGHLITPIYHGVDHKIFYPGTVGKDKEPYFLHISSYQPKKNLERIIAAYRRMSCKSKPRFKIVAPGYPHANYDEGIELIKKPLDHQSIALLYRNALGFIFPSLSETFGMPIIEAMACGCPVITSNHPGCVEIAGDAAVIVNPYSVGEIKGAMRKLSSDSVLWQSMHERGINRAKQFSWNKCAKEHLIVFQRLMMK